MSIVVSWGFALLSVCSICGWVVCGHCILLHSYLPSLVPTAQGSLLVTFTVSMQLVLVSHEPVEVSNAVSIYESHPWGRGCVANLGNTRFNALFTWCFPYATAPICLSAVMHLLGTRLKAMVESCSSGISLHCICPYFIALYLSI